ncbi:MAG TPA: hypothetical protein VI911_11850 [Patescibacteria group bacterium]|nr:hypothetical protein [Patescibacteria group bacterium]
MKECETPADRIYRNLCSIPSFNTTVTRCELMIIFERYSDICIIRGKFRKIQVTEITNGFYNIYTKEL